MLKVLIFLCISLSVFSADFQGWQGLRVLPIEGGISASDSADVNGDGKETLFIVNRRQSRIDIYNWLSPDKRVKPEVANSPNELPLASDFKRDEIVLERPPFDILLSNFDDDKEKELVVLTTLPLTLHLYDFQKNEWHLKDSWKLPNHNLQSLSILRYKDSIFVSTEAGVVIQKLEKNAPAQWLKPKEKGLRRYNWWIMDLDNDGKEDLVDLVLGPSDKVHFRWSKRSQKQFLPAVPIGSIGGSYANIDKSGDKPSFYFHNPLRTGTVNEYSLERAEENEFGMNRILPILNLRNEGRTAVVIDGKPCLVELDPARPMMRVSHLGETGFSEIGSFPVLRGTKKVISPPGKSFLLMQVGDSPSLYISRWEKGRFSYPSVYEKQNSAAEKILGFGRHASTVWWIESSGDSLALFTWEKGKKEASKTEFKGVGKGLDQAYWVGGTTLMTKKKYAKYASFYTLKDNKAEQIQIPHLKDAVESQFRFFELKGKLQVSRIIDGIVQLYGDDFQPVDQIMLDDGLKIIDAVLLNDEMLVLDQTGKKLHRLKKDSTGVMRTAESIEVLQANGIHFDQNMGLMLSNTKMINAIKKGQPFKFKLQKSVNEKLGLPAGVKNANIDHFYLAHVTGSAKKELINVDYARRQLTLINLSSKKAESLASWKVYDDGKYPYSDGSEAGSSGANPYMIFAMDFDGDGIKELVMGCHDRLLIYLGKESVK